MKKILQRSIIIFITWFVVHSILISIDGRRDGKKFSDVAVILGNKVNEDGTLSERLRKRLDCGINLYNERRVKKIIVSGGLGKEGFYEGDKMKEYLSANGVPDSLIITDNKGDNTLLTVKNTLLLKDSLHFNSLIIVSQYYHLTRTKMLFRKSGFNEIDGVSPYYYEWRDVYSLFREFFAYYTQLL